MNKKEILELIKKALESDEKELSSENRKVLLTIEEKVNQGITKQELFSYLVDVLKVISGFGEWFKDP